MAKRRVKKRTHVRPQSGAANAKNGAASMSKSPKSMVIRVGAGEVGSSVSQLVKDVRLMMEPDTASRLKERKANKLKDYTTMAGPLGVTHLLLFSKSSTGNTNMRLALTPRGPTLHFRIESYSLCRDVEKAQKHPRGGGQDHRTPPLLVMNNFMTNADENAKIPKRLESLTTTIFQSLFPPISPQTTPLSSIRRIMLLNRELNSASSDGNGQDSYILNLRHYAITTRKTGIPKRLRRLDPKELRHKDKKKSAIPDLGKLNDAADYLLDPSAGYYSASETELDTDAEVEVAGTTTKKVLNKRELQRMKNGEKKGEKLSTSSNVEKRAVKLVELGPRMKLRLIKVEEGLCGGRVMWHDFMKKSEDEVKEMDETWDRRRKEKEQRKKEQKENIERKKQEKAKAKANGEEVQESEEDEDEYMDSEWESDDLDGEEEVEQDDEDSDESMEED
ncbi:hypothetical protein VTN02DRAFT_4103 [Thermoascus thermophilus]